MRPGYHAANSAAGLALLLAVGIAALIAFTVSHCTHRPAHAHQLIETNGMEEQGGSAQPRRQPGSLAAAGGPVVLTNGRHLTEGAALP